LLFRELLAKILQKISGLKLCPNRMYAQIASWLLFKRYTNYIVQNPGMENIMVILHTQLDQHIRTTLEHTKYKLFSFYNILYNVLLTQFVWMALVQLHHCTFSLVI